MNNNLDLEGILNHGKLIEEKDTIFSIDENKAFLKLSMNQFENPLDSVRELIANAIDSYTKQDKNAIIEIESRVNKDCKNNIFSVLDYGSGMDNKKIELLRTLGLTDKSKGSIGRFGIGFASIFSPKLKVKKVIVDTNNKGLHYQIIFNVKKNSVPSMKKYEFADKIDFGTKISIISDSYDTICRMRRHAEEVCRFLPHEIKINGEKIRKGRLIALAERGVNINQEGIGGYIELSSDDCYPKLNLLSKNLLVERKEFKDFSNTCVGKLYLPNIEGVINNDAFNLVVSRNEVIEDEESEKVKSVVSSKGTTLLSKLLDCYKSNPSGQYREIILHNIANFCNEGHNLFEGGFMNEFKENNVYYSPNNSMESLFYLIMSRFGERKEFSRVIPKRKTKEFYETVKLLEKVIGAEVFRSWNEGYISLTDIHKRIGERGLILVSDNENKVEMIDEDDMRNVVIKRESVYEDDEELFSKVYQKTPNIIDLDKEDIKELVGRRLIRLKTPERLYKKIKDDDVDNNYRSFLNHIKSLLEIEEIKKVKEKYRLADRTSICYAKLGKKETIAACNKDMSEVYINPENSVVKKFVKSKNQEQNILYFIPVLSHELVHNKISNHLESFYRENSAFDMDMRIAIARYVSKQDK